jgi:oligopeptidase B
MTTPILDPQERTDSAGAPVPPVAGKRPKVDVVHGERRVDDYFWMRDRADPEVAAYLEAENAYADAVMKPTEAFQDALYKEMLGRIKETDTNVPYRRGGYFYHSRTEEGRQYPILGRRKGSLDAAEEITLDLNALAEGRKFMSLGSYVVSDDARLLAYATDDTGFRQYTLYVKDLGASTVPLKIAEKVGSVAWAADNRTLFYTVEEESTKRQYRVYRHVLGTDVHHLVYEEADLSFNVGVGRTRSLRFVVLAAGSLTTTEVQLLEADAPAGPFRMVAPRIAEQEYDVDHRGEWLFIRTNDTGRNFRLVKAAVGAPGREGWQEVIPHRAEVMLEGIDVFAEHLVLLEREGGLPHLRVLSDAGESHRIAFPEPTYSAFPGANAEFEATTYRYTYESLVTPVSTFDYDVAARASTLMKQVEVRGGYDPARYRSERLFATAADGVKVPISLVYREGFVRNGKAPLYLYGYGSYGLSMTAAFSSNRLSLLDRGIVFAIAHIRGGGELGKPWHDDGRLGRKLNTFTDFVACAEFLVKEGYADPGKVVAEGGSAGGLLMGVVCNRRPDLWKAVVSKVPFVDVINSMLDETLPLTVGEFEEWGNPKDPGDYAYIRAYCPYSNLARQAYPALLVKTSFHDSQVMYWEPAKYVARMRTLKTDGNPVLLKTNMAAGHGGASGRYDALRETAFDYAFVLTRLGLAPAPAERNEA